MYVTKHLLKSKLLFTTPQRFFAINASQIDSALTAPQSVNWSQFFSGVRAGDVAGSDIKAVGKLLKALSLASK
jgi:hypothetical protein